MSLKTIKKASASHDYIMKIVPTIYEEIDGSLLYPYQFTFAHREYSPYAHSGYKVFIK